MPVQIGATTHSFSDPTALLSDCHRRIEMFLGSLEKVGAHIQHPLSNETRAALESALRYFREAAPKHTADEEQSVFPRLRHCRDSEVETALSTLDDLEQEHRRADAVHGEVDMLGKRVSKKVSFRVSRRTSFESQLPNLPQFTRHISVLRIM
jgi:iron-sulfur cluster repair protein YtfE (RIC family)